MGAPRRGRRLLAIVAGPVLLAGVLAGLSPASASAAACHDWTGLQPPSPGAASNGLEGVTVLSACNAWAVGYDISGGPYQTLIEHWNGSSWRVVPSPDPGGSANFLRSVRAVSPTSIWAVGDYSSPGATKTLIVHWNAKAWKQVPSPSPGKFGELDGVRAVSARSVWAVGGYTAGGHDKTLIEHWNGTRWARVASPNPGTDNELFAVTATSSRDAWAVGEIPGEQADIAGRAQRAVDTPGSATNQAFIVHWNGRKWRHVASPSPGSGSELDAVGATSASNAWAVGYTSSGSIDKTLVLHWNGRRWTRMASPSTGREAFLTGVTATSARNAWAVGDSIAHSGGVEQPLILRWNGRRWSREASPQPSPDGAGLFAVAAASAGNGWAVGAFQTGTGSKAFAVHCC
jgi:hypothetical protein